MKLSAAITLIAILTAFLPAHGNDVNSPHGWATCSSIHSAGDYDLTGGNDGSLIVLRADGADMRGAVADAVNNYDIIVFDGSNGDFVFPSHVSFYSLSGKTLIGVNGARLCTEFHVTQEIRDMLDELNVNSLSQNAGDDLGGTLSNGSYVAELRELTIRQALIDRYGDPKEPYRYAGVFLFNGCSNIILRNLDFCGPGSLDVGGSDLLTIYRSDHVWVDHCRFTDGLDGNLDIVNNSDFVTVSDTRFRYTDLAYNHPLSNLVSGSAMTDGSPQKCNVSWIRCFWDEGCTGRMPFTAFGVHHILNCYWDCAKGTCIDAHDLSKILIENSYFTNKVGKALAVRQDNVLYEWRGSVWQGRTAPQSNATIDIPYPYTVMETAAVPSAVSASAGVTLSEPFTKALSSFPAEIDFGEIYADNQAEARINISAYGRDIPPFMTLTAPEGVLLAADRDGEYSSSLRLEACDETLFQADVYVKASFSGAGNAETAIEVSAPGTSFSIPVKADVKGLDGERLDATLLWTFDKGASTPVDASTARPEIFERASFSLGGKLAIHSAHKIGSSQMFTLFNPSEAIDKIVDDDCCITFDVVTVPGCAFIPKKLKLLASRVGTDMCYVDIECGRPSGESKKLVSALHPDRSSDSPAYSEIELPLGNMGVGDSLQIKIYLYYMVAAKQLALADVMIEGDAYAAGSAAEPSIVDATTEKCEYYDLTGRRVFHPQCGALYLMRCGDGNAKLIVYPG